MINEINKITDCEIIEELKTFPNQAFIWAIADFGMCGKIYGIDSKAVLIVENSLSPFVFLAGKIDEKNVIEAIGFLKDFEYPIIYCNEKYHPLFLKNGFDLLLRAQLSLRNLDHFDSKMAQDKKILPINNIELFEQCLEFEEKSRLYINAENFLKYGSGYTYFENNQIVSESYAIVGGGCAEVSVVTSPHRRGRGNILFSLLPIIEDCRLNNLTPIWSCQLDNRSSLKAAIRLGFELESYYVCMVPECGNVLSRNLINWLYDNPDLKDNPFL